MTDRAPGGLVQGLGAGAATALVAGNIIGSGIYVIPASLADVAGPLSLLAWPVVALGYLALNAVYADLGEAYPIQGGLQVYAATAFGPLAGLIAGTLYWVSCVVGNAAFMTAFVGYAAVFVPPIARPMPAFLLAQTLLWSLTAVNLAGVKAGGRVQAAATVVKIVPLVVLAAALLPHADRANLTPFAPKGWSALFPAIALVAWPFIGAETATIPAGEMKDPRRTIRLAAFAGFTIAAAVYVAVAASVALALPAAEIAGSPSPMAVAARRVLGTWGESFVTAGALASVAGILNGWILIAGRLPQAAARDGYAPKVLARLSARTGAPVPGLLVSGALAAVLASTYFTRSLLAAYNFIALAATATALIAIALTCGALVVLTRREPDRFRPVQRARAPLLAAAGLAVVAVLLRGSGREVWTFTLGVALLPVPVFLWSRRALYWPPSSARD
jgi:APA family basic amino acid/polyamine antiporter